MSTENTREHTLGVFRLCDLCISGVLEGVNNRVELNLVYNHCLVSFTSDVHIVPQLFSKTSVGSIACIFRVRLLLTH